MTTVMWCWTSLMNTAVSGTRFPVLTAESSPPSHDLLTFVFSSFPPAPAPALFILQGGRTHHRRQAHFGSFGIMFPISDGERWSESRCKHDQKRGRLCRDLHLERAWVTTQHIASSMVKGQGMPETAALARRQHVLPGSHREEKGTRERKGKFRCIIVPKTYPGQVMVFQFPQFLAPVLNCSPSLRDVMSISFF